MLVIIACWCKRRIEGLQQIETMKWNLIHIGALFWKKCLRFPKSIMFICYQTIGIGSGQKQA